MISSRKSAGEKVEERFIGLVAVCKVIVDRAQDVVGLSEEVAFLQLAINRAPQVTFNFGDFQIMLLHRKPNFWREAVNKFSAQLDGMIQCGIVASEHASANPIASFDNFYPKSGTGKFNGSRKSGGS